MLSSFTPALTGLEVEFLWRLVAAALLGAALGFERSLSGKHAGMRTYALVALGSCLFVINSVLSAVEFVPLFSAANPVYIAASVVVGIGFIGAGLAALRGEHPELTTGTGIWVTAAVGMACGFGFYTLATATTIIGLIIFTVFARIEHSLRVRYGADARD